MFGEDFCWYEGNHFLFSLSNLCCVFGDVWSLAEKVASVIGCIVISMEDYRCRVDDGNDLDSIDFDALVQNLEVCIVFMFLNCSLQNVLSWINWIANERFMQFWVDCCRCCLKLLTCILTWPDYKKTIGILVVVETFLIRVKTYLIKAALNLQ